MKKAEEKFDAGSLIDMVGATTPEEIAAAQNIKSVSVKPEGVEFVEFDVPSFLFSAKMFVERKTSVSDVLSRAVLVQFDRSNKGVTMHSSDGLMFMQSSFSYQSISDNFPEEIVLDVETLYNIIKLRQKKVYLVFVDKDIYVDFFGGRVFVPVYNIKSEILLFKRNEGVNFREVQSENLLSLFTICDLYMSTINVPDLSFVEIRSDCAYLANGYSVLRVGGRYVDFKLRKVDLHMVSSVVQQSMRSNLGIGVHASSIVFDSESAKLSMPLVSFPFSEEYVKSVSILPEKFYRVDYNMLYTIIALLEKTYQSSGVVSIISKNNVLFVESLTRSGKKSYMRLVDSSEPISAFRLILNVKNLLSVLRVFRGSSTVNVGFIGSSLYVFTQEGLVLNLFGKNEG